MVFITDRFFEVARERVGFEHWTTDFPSDAVTDYQARSLTRTQSLLFKATPIPSFVQCHI